MALRSARPARRFVPGGPELPGARSEEREAQVPRLDEPMDLVEERRDSLDLVEDDEGAGRRLAELESQQPGVGEELLVATLVEQVHGRRPGELAGSPGALPGAADAEGKEAPTGDGGQAGIRLRAHIAVIMTRKMTASHTALGNAQERSAREDAER